MPKPTCATCVFFFPFENHELGLGRCHWGTPQAGAIINLSTNSSSRCHEHTTWSEDATHEGWRKTFDPDKNFRFLKPTQE